MKILENKNIIIGIISLLVLIIVLLSGISLYLYNREPNCDMAPLTLIDSNNEVEEVKEEEKITIHVEIKGAVKNPWVYEASTDEIINDIVAKAGGLNSDAYTDNINLSKKVSDELVIYVYTKEEMKKNNSNKNVVSNSVGNANSYNIETYTEGKVSIISSNDNNVTQDNTSTLININTADATKLEELPGIGATKANSIIAYREEVGGFKSIEDLKNVSGIGDATFEKLKDYITV